MLDRSGSEIDRNDDRIPQAQHDTHGIIGGPITYDTEAPRRELGLA